MPEELATHIGEVVINKCFCTRRNPISISAAAIYLACQLEDKRKTQAEICKVTGLTEVTLRKVYKELLENWDDLLPSNYTPAVPPEKAFPTTAITSGRSSSTRVDPVELASTSLDKDKQAENKSIKPIELSGKGKSDAENNAISGGIRHPAWQGFRQPWLRFGSSGVRTTGEESPNMNRGSVNESQSSCQDLEEKTDKQKMEIERTGAARPSQFSSPPTSGVSTITWPFRSASSSGSSPIVQPPPRLAPGFAELKGVGNQNGGKSSNHSGDNK